MDLPYWNTYTNSCTAEPTCNGGDFVNNQCQCNNPENPVFDGVNCNAGQCPTGVAWIVENNVGKCDCPSGTYSNGSLCTQIPTCNWNDAEQ